MPSESTPPICCTCNNWKPTSIDLTYGLCGLTSKKKTFEEDCPTNWEPIRLVKKKEAEVPYCCGCNNWLPDSLGLRGICAIIGTGTTSGDHSCSDFKGLMSWDKATVLQKANLTRL